MFIMAIENPPALSDFKLPLVPTLGDTGFHRLQGIKDQGIVKATVSGVFEDSQQGRVRTTSILVRAF